MERFGKHESTVKEIKSRLLGIGGGSGGACEMRGHSRFTPASTSSCFFLGRLKHKRSVDGMAMAYAKAKGMTQYAMGCLNGGGTTQHGLKFPCGLFQPPTG